MSELMKHPGYYYSLDGFKRNGKYLDMAKVKPSAFSKYAGTFLLIIAGAIIAVVLAFWVFTHLIPAQKVSDNAVNFNDDWSAIQAQNIPQDTVYSVGFPICLQNCINDNLTVQEASGYKTMDWGVKIQ